MTPELERYIERVHRRTKDEAERAARRDARIRSVWSSEGGTAFTRFVETRPSPATQRAYRQHLEDFVRWIALNCEAIDPLDATITDLAEYERCVSTQLSERTGKRLALRSRQERIRTVRTAYHYCVDEGLLDRSPARHVRVVGRAQPRRTFLKDADAAALIRACSGGRPSDRRDLTLVLLLLHTGLRAAEAAALTWGDLGLDGAATLTVEGKGRVVRTIPLSTAAAGALMEWASFSGSRRIAREPVITRVKHRLSGEASRSNRSGEWEHTPEPLSADAVHGIVTRRAARAGLKDVTPHALRRTFATKLRDLGVSIDTISRYLGHASIQTTVAYFNPEDTTATAAVRELSYSVE